MNKIILALATVTALSTAAVAERSYDLRDSPEARGTFSVTADQATSGSDVNTLPQVDEVGTGKLLLGKYGFAESEAELRRWDEKNSN